MSKRDYNIAHITDNERWPTRSAQGDGVDVSSLLGARPNIVTHERRDSLTEAQAFMLKYAGLSVVLIVLAVALSLRLELNFATGMLVFAGMAVAAYWLLGYTEALFTGPGVERHRLTMGSRVLMRQIEADERIALAEIRLRRVQLITAHREAAPQLPAVEGVQGVTGQGSTFVAPYTPKDIAEAVAYAEGLYDRDGLLSSRHVHTNGKIRTGVIGSQNQGGNVNARQYLIDRRFLVQREGGYWIGKGYPTARELARLRVGAGTEVDTYLPNR